jgi:hypothetical protein
MNLVIDIGYAVIGLALICWARPLYSLAEIVYLDVVDRSL